MSPRWGWCNLQSETGRWAAFPTADAVGFIMSPLRGWLVCAARSTNRAQCHTYGNSFLESHCSRGADFSPLHGRQGTAKRTKVRAPFAVQRFRARKCFATFFPATAAIRTIARNATNPPRADHAGCGIEKTTQASHSRLNSGQKHGVSSKSEAPFEKRH